MTPLRADPAAGPVRVAATQSALGDIAVQIGGSDVSLRPLSAATLSGDAADLVLVEGGPTDSWARALLQRLPRHIAVLRSTDASDPSPGFSWYDISGMRRLSGEIAAALIRQRPSEAQAIGDRLSRFEAALDGLDRQASELAAYYRDSSVLLSDPRFAPLLRTLHLKGVPVAPAAAGRAIAAHKGLILIYDAEAPGAAGANLKAMADDAGLPVVALRQSLPSGLHYQTWLGREINAIRGALNEAAP